MDGFCCCSVAQSCLTVTPRTAAQQASLSFTISWSLLKLMSIGSVMPSHYLILCYPLLCLPSIAFRNRFFFFFFFLMSQVLTSGGQRIGAFSFSISPSNEHSGSTFFRIDWLELLVVQGTLKSFHQHHSSKPSVLHHSAFFMIQLSHPSLGFPGGQMVKNPPAMQKIWVQFLSWEDPWRRVWHPTPVFLPGESPRAEESGGLQPMELQRVGHY